MAVRNFDGIVVKVDGKAIAPSDYEVDVEYIEQEKVPAHYVEALFSELWQTGGFSHDSMERLVGSALVYGKYAGDELFIGGARSFDFDWSTGGGRAYE